MDLSVEGIHVKRGDSFGVEEYIVSGNNTVRDYARVLFFCIMRLRWRNQNLHTVNDMKSRYPLRRAIYYFRIIV